MNPLLKLARLNEAASKYRGREEAFACEVLGALMNKISQEDLEWAIKIAEQALPLAEQIRSKAAEMQRSAT